MYDVTLITPTGDRPEALQLCCRFMERQTFVGTVQWVIVHDGHDQSVNSPQNVESVESVPVFHVPENWEVVKLFRDPGEDPPSPLSLIKNLKLAIEHVAGEKILIIEDDDWYSPEHVADMARRLDRASAVGSNLQSYYHLPKRIFANFTNDGSCLCQTGFRREILPVLLAACEDGETDNNKNIDSRFWVWMKSLAKQGEAVIDLFTDRRDVVGIKGLPGRKGLGVGHSPRNLDRWKSDSDLRVLREWVGDDATTYAELVPSRQSTL